MAQTQLRSNLIKNLKLPFYLILAIVAGVLANFVFTEFMLRVFYTISLNMKVLLMWFLPLVIFSSVYHALNSMSDNALAFVVKLLGTIVIANLFVVVYAGGVAYSFLDDSTKILVQELSSNSSIQPIFKIFSPIPHLNEASLFLGFLLGLLSIKFKVPKFNHNVKFLLDACINFLKKIFIPLLPLFIFGLVINMQAEGYIYKVVVENWHMIFAILLVELTVLVGMVFLASKGNLSKAKSIVLNSLPACLTGFSSMSSMAALPLSLDAANKNTNSKILSEVFMPATVNTHSTGDNVFIPLLALLAMLSVGQSLPSFSTYLVFCGVYTLTRFAGAGIPGGSIIVMAPVFQNILGFHDGLIAIITSLYIICDPIITFCNVLGNNLLVVIYKNLLHK